MGYGVQNPSYVGMDEVSEVTVSVVELGLAVPSDDVGLLGQSPQVQYSVIAA